MLALKTFRDRAPGVADLLNWAALVDDGIVQCKDGSLLAGWAYRAPDGTTLPDLQRNYFTERVNSALARLGSGWVSWHEAARIPSTAYPGPEESAFPDPVTRAIDDERRVDFESEGGHFETEYMLIVMYTPPVRVKSRVVEIVYDDEQKMPANRLGDRILAGFKKSLSDIEDSLADVLDLDRLGGYLFEDVSGRQHLRDRMLNCLNFTLTGQMIELNVPSHGMYLDAVLGGQELWGGDTPRYGENYISCVAIEGFPAEGYPGLLDTLNELPLTYRWSSRMIYLDDHEAVRHLDRYRKKWRQRMRGFVSQVFRTQGGPINEDALLMAGQAEDAMTDANSGLVKFGYYTAVIVLMDPDRQVLSDNARQVLRDVQNFGFACRIETINTMEAWLGSLPGHPIPNVRRPLIHTLNLSDLLPLSSVWPGREFNPCDKYPPGSLPLLYGKTAGATPFRLNLHVGDVGHTLVMGPTGAGKSVLLAAIAAQFRRYPRATVFAFDKGMSLWPLCEAAGGHHYEIAGGDRSPGFAPLMVLESSADRLWAEEWIATCYELQTGGAPTPNQKAEIHRATSLFAKEQPADKRSLTEFLGNLQDVNLREGLTPYTISGAMGHLVDSDRDELQDTDFAVFELDEFMRLGEKIVIPVLLHLFRRFEKQLKGQPALLLLDEAWMMLNHSVFRNKIIEWLKTLRKANCAVVMATQSLSDAVRSGILDIILESCPTRILLPNTEATKEGSAQVLGPADFYRLFGLNDREIDIISRMIPKRQYYYTSPEGRRPFELGLGPVAVAFLASSSKEQISQIRKLRDIHGQEWPSVWLDEKGIDHDINT